MEPTAFFDFPQGGETLFSPFFDDSAHGICGFCRFLIFPRVGKAGFSRFPIKKLRFFGSRRLIPSKNCDFFAPDGYFCQKIAIFLLLTLISTKNGGRFCLLTLISAKNGGRFYLPRPISAKNVGGFAPPRGRKRGNSRFLSIRGLGKLVFGNFYSAEPSDELFFSFSVNPRARLGCFSYQ